ncbi:hypothetical protein DFH09DRAFT_1179046 [Mycena vulgaris]|nr:hypothetical protein DFH09DRAFT_1179046 [Mycena vulgaris]
MSIFLPRWLVPPSLHFFNPSLCAEYCALMQLVALLSCFFALSLAALAAPMPTDASRARRDVTVPQTGNKVAATPPGAAKTKGDEKVAIIFMDDNEMSMIIKKTEYLSSPRHRCIRACLPIGKGQFNPDSRRLSLTLEFAPLSPYSGSKRK